MLLLKRFSPPAFDVIDTFMDHDADRQKVLFTVTIIPIPFIGLFWDPIKFLLFGWQGKGSVSPKFANPGLPKTLSTKGGGGYPFAG